MQRLACPAMYSTVMFSLGGFGEPTNLVLDSLGYCRRVGIQHNASPRWCSRGGVARGASGPNSSGPFAEQLLSGRPVAPAVTRGVS